MEGTSGSAAEEEARLRDLAARIGARYEVFPDTEVVDHQIVRVGFELQLYALHEHEHERGAQIVGPECFKAYDELREIAEWIMPTASRPSRYEIEDFDRALHAEPGTSELGEIRLTVKILHRRDFFAPIDACEETCLEEMKEKLARLGVREGLRRAEQPQYH
jgi:hypothetical protein